MFECKIEGFDEMKRKLDQLEARIRRVAEKKWISLHELLPDSFMRTHTRFLSAQEMLDKSPFKIDSKEDFEAIPDDKWDEYVRGNTDFSNWREMLSKAAEDMVKRELQS